jgi:hypothetical protein
MSPEIGLIELPSCTGVAVAQLLVPHNDGPEQGVELKRVRTHRIIEKAVKSSAAAVKSNTENRL